MRHVLFIGGMGSVSARFWNHLHRALVSRGHPGMLAIVYGWWDGKQHLDFPHVVFSHLSHLGPTHDVDASSGGYMDTLLDLFDVTAPIDAAILLSGTHRILHHWRLALERKQILTIHNERSGLYNAMILDPSGLNGMAATSHESLSQQPIDPSLVEQYATLFDNPDSTVDDATSFIEKCHQEGRKVVLYLGLWDEASGIRDADPLYAMATSPSYNSSQEALNELIASLEKRGEPLALIVKGHPAGGFAEALNAESPALPILVLPPERKPFSLISACDVVATIASTLSYVAVAKGIPVLLMGRNLLSNKHVAYEVTPSTSLDEAITLALQKDDWTTRLANREQFLWAFARDYHHYTILPNLIELGIKPLDAFVPVLEQLVDDTADKRQQIPPKPRYEVMREVFGLITSLRQAGASIEMPFGAQASA